VEPAGDVSCQDPRGGVGSGGRPRMEKTLDHRGEKPRTSTATSSRARGTAQEMIRHAMRIAGEATARRLLLNKYQERGDDYERSSKDSEGMLRRESALSRSCSRDETMRAASGKRAPIVAQRASRKPWVERRKEV